MKGWEEEEEKREGQMDDENKRGRKLRSYWRDREKLKEEERWMKK